MNKCTQSYEKEYIHEFRLHLAKQRPTEQAAIFQQANSISEQSGEVCLFASSAVARSEWVRHIQYIYERGILEILNRSLSDSSDSEYKRKKANLKKQEK